MKARLRAAALLAGAFCCLLLPSGCADKPSESMTPDPIRIGVTLYRQSDTFISLLASDLLDCAKALEFQLQDHSLQRNPRVDLLQNGLVGSP